MVKTIGKYKPLPITKVVKPIKKIKKKKTPLKISKDMKGIGKHKIKNRKVLRKFKRSTLDLRRPEREEPVKQHGFKEQEIGNNNFLFN